MQHCVATKSIAIAKMLNIAPLELTTDDKLGNDKKKQDTSAIRPRQNFNQNSIRLAYSEFGITILQ